MSHFKRFSNPTVWYLSPRLFLGFFSFTFMWCYCRVCLLPAGWKHWFVAALCCFSSSLYKYGPRRPEPCAPSIKPECWSVASNLIMWSLPPLFLKPPSVLILTKLHLSNTWNNCSFWPCLTWQHHRHGALTSCCAHQHAAYLLPAVAALTFSTIIRLLLINSLACSVCFISKPATLSSGFLQQQQQHHRETWYQSLNWSNKQDRKCPTPALAGLRYVM